MLESLIIGGVANLVSKYAGAREEKARVSIQIQQKEAEHRMEIERMETQKRLELEISNNELIKTQVQAEIDKMQIISDNRKDNASLDKIIYTKMDKTIINVIALMKPIITYSLLFMLISVAFYGIFASDNEAKYSHYKSVVNLLDEVGILDLAEMAIGFWFGALGMDQMSKKK
jgi:hypothetical protein